MKKVKTKITFPAVWSFEDCAWTLSRYSISAIRDWKSDNIYWSDMPEPPVLPQPVKVEVVC